MLISWLYRLKRSLDLRNLRKLEYYMTLKILSGQSILLKILGTS